MSSIILVGGGIGCGKTTLINFILKNKKSLFLDLNTDQENKMENNELLINCLVIQFDSLCSIEEQERMMKTLKGLRNFRADLLMAAERFIAFSCRSANCIVGPLSERSNNILMKLYDLNSSTSNSSLSRTIVLVEDNFYYRSMRYDWLQIARRINLGFATIFLHCPLSTAIQRNATRGYQIPEDRIKKMMSFVELPDPAKFKWEKMSVIFDSSSELTNLALTDVMNVIIDSLKNPVELILTKDMVEAQKICSKNVVHQSDRILRKLVSKMISILKESYLEDDNLKFLISTLVNLRQKLFCDIKQGTVNLPEDLVDKIQNLGIESVINAYEERLQELFIMTLKEAPLDLSMHLNKLQIQG